jgi:hypothetical protein
VAVFGVQHAVSQLTKASFDQASIPYLWSRFQSHHFKVVIVLRQYTESFERA